MHPKTAVRALPLRLSLKQVTDVAELRMAGMTTGYTVCAYILKNEGNKVEGLLSGKTHVYASVYIRSRPWVFQAVRNGLLTPALDWKMSRLQARRRFATSLT